MDPAAYQYPNSVQIIEDDHFIQIATFNSVWQLFPKLNMIYRHIDLRRRIFMHTVFFPSR